MLNRLALVGFLSIACLPNLVNAKPQGKDQKKISNLDKLITETITSGEDGNVPPNVARDLGLAPNLKTRERGYNPEESNDKRTHAFIVVLSSNTPSGATKPQALIFQAKKKENSALESHLFRLAPAGTIEKAITLTGKLDENGKSIPGSAVTVDMDQDDAKHLLKKELDFWLHGVGLKKAVKRK